MAFTFFEKFKVPADAPFKLKTGNPEDFKNNFGEGEYYHDVKIYLKIYILYSVCNCYELNTY